MQPLRRTAATAARKARVTLPRQPRRWAHDEHAHGHSHGPVNESMGTGFWLVLGAFPAGWALYAISRADDQDKRPFFNRIIDKYTESQQKLADKNDLHVRMMEQAGDDRVLFMNSKPQEHVPMKFPEIMNVGSPYNVPAGSVNQMEKVIAKFKQEAYEDNERKLEALRNGTIKAEQPYEPFDFTKSKEG